MPTIPTMMPGTIMFQTIVIHIPMPKTTVERTPKSVVLENDMFCLEAGRGSSMILRSGYLYVRNGGRRIMIGPGYGTHAFKGHYQGEERNESGYSIFLNDYTPYERTFRIIEER